MKKLARLLGAVLVLTLAFSAAAFAADTDLVLSLDAGQELKGITTVDFVSFDMIVSTDSTGANSVTANGKNGADTPADVTGAKNTRFSVKIENKDGKMVLTIKKGDTATTLAGTAAADAIALTTDTSGAVTLKYGATTPAVAGVALGEVEPVTKTFKLKADQTVAGKYDGTKSPKVFTGEASQTVDVTFDTDKLASIDLSGKTFTLTSDDTTPTSFSITSSDAVLKVKVGSDTAEYTFATFALKGSADVEGDSAEPFDSASFDVYAAGKKVATVTFTSKDAEESVTVSTDVTVSFDLGKVGATVLKVASGDTELVSKDGVYSLDIAKVAKIVTIKFASGDNNGSFDVKLTINVDTAASKEYVLNLKGSTFKFTGSNGQSASFDAKTSTYATSSALASVDANGSWGTMSFTVSSDVFSDFVISVDFPASASVAAVYYREGTTGSFVADTDAYKAKVLSPYEGYYKFVFSADLIASSDSSVSGKSGYFGFTVQVASVDSSSSSTLVEESAASVEPVTRSDGNMEIPAGKTIKTKFLSSNGTLTAAIVSAFFNSNNATSVEMATPAQLTAALSQLGFTASDLGDAENGYKIVGLALPSNVTLSEGMKFFVMITTAKDGSGTNALGMGVLSKKQLGLGFLPIVFKLLKNPANTNNYMTFPAGNYFVGATNDMGESSSSTSARVVFVTADDKTFTIAADDTTLLQGQNASGDAQAYTGDDDDDDDNQETSSHGSSSGCDAGFGALALLAVAGALAARKVRK